MKKPVIQPCPAHLDAFGEDKGPLELPGGDAAMQIYALGIVRLLAAHDELIILNRNPEVAHCEAGHREGNPQGILAKLFDVVGRISVSRNLADSIERSLEVIEPQE